MKENKAVKIFLAVLILFIYGHLALSMQTFSIDARHKSKYANYSYDGIVDPMDILRNWKLTSKEYGNNAYKIFFENIDSKITIACIGFSLDTKRFSYVYVLRDEVYFFAYNAETNYFERRDISKKTKEEFRYILVGALDGCNL